MQKLENKKKELQKEIDLENSKLEYIIKTAYEWHKNNPNGFRKE